MNLCGRVARHQAPRFEASSIIERSARGPLIGVSRYYAMHFLRITAVRNRQRVPRDDLVTKDDVRLLNGRAYRSRLQDALLVRFATLCFVDLASVADLGLISSLARSVSAIMLNNSSERAVTS